jgi:hypothetical protein
MCSRLEDLQLPSTESDHACRNNAQDITNKDKQISTSSRQSVGFVDIAPACVLVAHCEANAGRRGGARHLNRVHGRGEYLTIEAMIGSFTSQS